MTVRTFTVTDPQRRLILQWARDQWVRLDQARMLTRPGSPQEESDLEDQRDVERIQELLR